ncbi:MAG: hypothetical protein UX60_C0013G0006 [Berkelbacteria bacterium GW2011_GWA2_46_7]|uniref:Uncharacterized protein n=1 Tax=Berkelbacteria bacterium GW2011_GWA2_46_7 TaxID=1618335 RepID=A0A0G1TEX0_9BACT|nr:MAG: hypothetical protein UX60_C0013G0006 [Berkelbacteria bacterium GW2011_GWA2_46_7]
MTKGDKEAQGCAQTLVLIGLTLIVLGFVGGINEWWGREAMTYVIAGLGALLLVIGCVWSSTGESS